MPAKPVQPNATLAAFPAADPCRQVAPVASPDGAATRQPGDDFFCLRFRVWYPSLDCAVRTRFRTCDACLDCDQGRFNLKRHRSRIRNRPLARVYRD